MGNRRSRCVYIISCLIIAVCLISFTDGDDHTEYYSGGDDGDSDTSTIADDTSSTATDAESKEVLQAFTQDPTSSANSFIVQASLESETTDDKRTTSTSSNNTIIQTSPKNRPTGDKGTTHIPTSSDNIFIKQTSPKDRPSDDVDDASDDKDSTQYPARSVDVTAPMQPKNGIVDDFNDKGSKKDHNKWWQDDNRETFHEDIVDIPTTYEVPVETESDEKSRFHKYEQDNNVQTTLHSGDVPETRRSGGVTTNTKPQSQSEKIEKSPTTVLILAGLIAVIISAGLSICISCCVASTIAKKKGYNKSDKMTESQSEVPLDQIVCTSVQSTEESSKPCNEQEVSVEVNQHENEQTEASKDEDVVRIADNHTNDETTVVNEQDNEATESVTENKDNNEASEAAIKLFVEQCMSGETVNNANAATGSLLTETQPIEKASVDATASIPSVNATNINAAPIDQPKDMPILNAAAVDPPQT